ncbi:MAG: hypothetical protein ABIH11_03800 [Candidatus Altiarchaeota archaeon]
MDVGDFKRVVQENGIQKGTFIALKTRNSVCTGYFLEAAYKTSQGGFVNLAGTRKLGQGREEEDWYDHSYSIPLARITDVQVLGQPFDE